MAALNSWQKLSRVVGNDFGDGSAGNTTISSDPNTRATASGSSGSTSLTIGSAILSNGDVFVIWQTQGATHGQWEINSVASGGGTTSITCSQNLQYTYGTGAQVIKFTMYDVVDINSFTTAAWNGSTGGITVICGRTSITINTSQSVIGGGGFVGGARAGDPGSPGSGEGASGNPGSQATGAGQGGGSGSIGYGGGYGTAGGGASGGSAYGSADLTTLEMGGGGSGASANPSTNASNGASSGSVIIYITKNFISTGASSSGGYGSGAATDRSGGGGSGSSTLVVCKTATLNTNQLVATGGTAGAASSQGTAGGVGRIAVHHSGTVTGTTNPTFDDTTETLLDNPVNSSKASIVVTNSYNNSAKTNILPLYPNYVKAYVPTIRQAINVVGNIKSVPFRKHYVYRIYDTSGNYVSTWSDEVLSDPRFRTLINGGPSEMTLKLARKFDSFGENVDVTLNYKVDVYVFDREQPSGMLLYRGYISDYSPTFDGRNQIVEITILPYWANLSYRILKNASGNTAIEYYSENPHLIFKDIIDKYRAEVGQDEINYTSTSIDTTATQVTYLYNANTVAEALQTSIELSPSDYFFRIDADGTAYYKQKATTATHTVRLGTQVSKLQSHKRMEDLRNVVYLIGGTPSSSTQLFRKYTRTSSLLTWGTREEKMIDQRITNTLTADIKATRFLDQNDTPEIRATIRILDSNGIESQKGYDIETIKVGDTVSIQNLKSSIKSESKWDISIWDTDYWDYSVSGITADIMHIISVDYTPDYVEIECSRRFPEVTKRIGDIERNLNDNITAQLPTTPTVVT